MSSIEIVELSKIPVKKRTVITGFAGAGFIGNTALTYAARAKGFKQVGHIQGNAMPPMMILIEGKPRHSFRIYTDDSDDFMFIITEAMLQADSAWTIGQELMTWLKKKGVKEIVAFEGFPFTQPSKNVFGYTTGGKNLQGYGVQPISEGAISGVNASLLNEAMKDGIECTVIFVPTHLIGSIDYQGAIDTIQVLENMFKLDVDTEQLKRMSEAFAKTTEMRQQQQKKGGFFNRMRPGETDT